MPRQSNLVSGCKLPQPGTHGLVRVSAGELLGRTHEELVLLLIQLRRQNATIYKAMETCHMEIEAQVRRYFQRNPFRIRSSRGLWTPASPFNVTLVSCFFLQIGVKAEPKSTDCSADANSLLFILCQLIFRLKDRKRTIEGLKIRSFLPLKRYGANTADG